MTLTESGITFLKIKELVLQVLFPLVLPFDTLLWSVNASITSLRVTNLFSKKGDLSTKTIDKRLLVTVICYLLYLWLALNGASSLSVL